MGGQHKPFEQRTTSFACRCFINTCSMFGLLSTHVNKINAAVRGGQTLKEAGIFPLPRNLLLRQETAGLMLTCMTVAMLMTEPTLWCRGSEELFAEECDASHGHLFLYSLVLTMATFIYFVLLMVLAVFNMRVSANELVCQRMVVEVGLFIFALGCAIFMTAPSPRA